MSEGPENSPAEERARRLEAQLAAVTARVFHLEQEVRALRGLPAAPVRLDGETSPPLSASRQERQKEAPEAALPSEAVHDLHGQAAAAIPRARPAASLESRVGSQWFHRIGIVAMLIGVAWFLKFAFDNRWVGPAGRILIGLVSGAALIAWSERFRSKGYAGFSYSLKALGSGILYLSLWAAFSLFHLVPPAIAFAGMIAVTAFNAYIAWRQSAELLAVYAIVGAFSTPLMLSTGRNQEVFLFSYLLLMNTAAMALLALKGWNRLLVLSFLGTLGFVWGWYAQFYAPAAYWTTACFLGLFVLLFAAATIMARPRGAHARYDDAARIVVSLANAACGFLGFYAMLSGNGSGRNTGVAWCALGFGAFYLGVRMLMERTFPGKSPPVGTRPASLADTQLSIAIVFLTLAVPLAVHGNWVTVGWMAEGAALLWVATRTRTALIQMLAAGALVLGLISLAMDASVAQTQVLWNIRFLSFAVSIAAMTICALLAHRQAGRHAFLPWETLAAASAVAAQVLLAIAGLLEIHTFWWGDAAPGHYEMRSLLVSNTSLTSAVWLVAIGVFAFWISARAALAPRLRDPLRWEALCLLTCGVIILFCGLGVQRQAVCLNLRFFSFLAAIGGFGYTAWLSRRPSANGAGTLWARVPAAAGLAANLLALVAVCFEISTYWAARAPAAERSMAERFSYSAWFLLAGAVLLAIGFRRRSAFLRWQGLVLLAVTIFKVFLLDTSTLSQGYRIVSFLALGALLLGVSFAYQRDWLHLRTPAGSVDIQ